MASTRALQSNTWLVTMIAVILVVVVLSAAKVVLIPLALAVLLTFLLAPVCDRVERLGVGRILSVIFVAALTFIVIGMIGWVVTGQVINLAGQIPRYQENIRQKIETVRIPSGGPLSRAAESIKELTQEIVRPQQRVYSHYPPEALEEEVDEPVPVQVVDGPMRPLEGMRETLGPLLMPLASAGIVIVFVIFMLVQRDDLRDRVLRLIGQGRLTVATQAIDDAARRVSRFLLMQLLINATYGLAAGIGLYFIGLPNALLWGVLATLVRFIPYVGPWIGSLLPIVFAMAVFDQWTPVLLVAGLFIVIELISNNLMEPLLYGHHTGISPVAILASAVFWAWLWGPLGLVLATPLTVCVVVMGRYIPRLDFLNVLLSDQPGLTPAARVYQRLLAMDLDDAFDICEAHLQDNSLLDLYEQVLLPSIVLAERDRHHDRIEPEREEAVYYGFRYLVEDLGERYRPSAEPTLPDQSRPSPQADRDPTEAGSDLKTQVSAPASISGLEPPFVPTILCVPARDLADEIACLMLAQLLEGEGVRAEVMPSGRTIVKMLDEIDQRQPDAVCLSALPPQTVARARGVCRRFASRRPELKVVVAFWTMSDLSTARERVAPCSPDRVVATLSDAINVLRQ